MDGKTLGRLERADLREIWVSEAIDFTPWLARQENLAILAATIGMELELEAQEKNVGPFRADILCRNLEDESWVLIENQLDRTDHMHLGQLLTYAAGLHTVTVVWIAAKFTEEHRASLDWLNEITSGRCRFFGLEVELWRIGDSAPAPRFNVISKPNDWSRSVERAARQIDDGEISETKAQQLRYWEAFNKFIEDKELGFRTRRPKAHGYMGFSIGRSGLNLALKVNSVENRIAAELSINGDHSKTYFALLHEQKDAIEKAAGTALSWEELPDRVRSRIALYLDNADPADEADWPRQHAWLADALVRLDRALRQRVRLLNVADGREDLEAA